MTLETTGCVCDPARGVECEHHARAPRPCPECEAAGRLIEAQSGVSAPMMFFVPRKEGRVMVPYLPITAAGFVAEGTEPKFYPRAAAFRVCNCCGHTEEVR